MKRSIKKITNVIIYIVVLVFGAVFFIYFGFINVKAKCPDAMVPIPGGIFFMKGAGEYFQNSTNLKLMGPYCIDKYEYPNKERVVPRNFVNWTEAKELCEKEEKRLCTSAEWQRACQGPKYKKFPYGNRGNRSICNTDNPGEPAYPRNLTKYIKGSGTMPNCVSDYGVYDMSGGLSEWVLDTWNDEKDKKILRGGSAVLPAINENQQIFKNGKWAEYRFSNDCYSLHWHTIDTSLDDDGFRCCKDAD